MDPGNLVALNAATDIVDSSDGAESVDGRVARRQRNINAVLDVVLEMFSEDAMFPSMEQVARRSGLSLRSLYRYFADPGELPEAAIARIAEVAAEIIVIRGLGEGPFADRLARFVDTRLELHERFGPVFRAAQANAVHHVRIQQQQAESQANLRRQFELEFAPELRAKRGAAREAAVASGDLLTQLQSIDFLRRSRQLSATDTRRVLADSLTALLG